MKSLPPVERIPTCIAQLMSGQPPAGVSRKYWLAPTCTSTVPSTLALKLLTLDARKHWPLDRAAAPAGAGLVEQAPIAKAVSAVAQVARTKVVGRFIMVGSPSLLGGE